MNQNQLNQLAQQAYEIYTSGQSGSQRSTPFAQLDQNQQSIWTQIVNTIIQAGGQQQTGGEATAHGSGYTNRG